MTHLVDPNKMVCRHAPVEPVAALVHVCKHCGASIEGIHCVNCDGLGTTRQWPELKCVVCRGTGIDRWEAVK